jgi:Nickel/cobalt transporter regulator
MGAISGARYSVRQIGVICGGHPVHQNASFHEHVQAIQLRFRTTRPIMTSCRGIGRLHRGMIMKKIILATLAATSLMTPAVSQAATQMGPVSSNFDDNMNFRRGEGEEREGRRNVRTRGDAQNNRGREESGQRVQEQQNPVAVSNWSQERGRERERNVRNRSDSGNNRSREESGQRVQEQQNPVAVRNWSQERGREQERNFRNRSDNGNNRSREESGRRVQEQQNPVQVRNWSQERERERDDDNRRYRGGERYNGGGDNNRNWNNNNDDDDRGYRGNNSQNYRWKQTWRNDSRYNWSGHRDRYRNHYRPGRYYSPYRGHSYRRYGIGINIGSAFFGSRYWISDPSYYRLPPAYGPYRWVRYYDDVLLIDLRSGRVVDAIHDFFW